MYIVAIFQIQTSGVQYIDELLGIISFAYIIYKYFSRSVRKKDYINKMVKAMIAMTSIGVLSNIIFKMQYGYWYVIEDMFLFFKPFLIFIAIYLFFEKENDTDNAIYLLGSLARIFTIILTAYLIYFEFSDNLILGGYSEWVPIPSIKYYTFYAKYPAFLAMCIGILVVILIADKKNNNWIYIILDCINLLFTQSGTAFIIIFLVFAFRFVKHTRKIKWYHICFLVIIGSLVGLNEIKEYILNPTAARSIMFRYSIIAAMQFFPFGAGFSTYGGTVAGAAYSKLYIKYGFNIHWGMTGKGDVNFLYDTYYAMVIGELGIIGTIIYIIVIGTLFSQFNNVDSRSQMRYPLLLGLISVLVMGIGQGGLTSILGALYMMILALLYKKAKLVKQV